MKRATANQNRRVIRATELAEILGCDLSTVWRWRKEGVLPAPRRLGGMTFWTAEQVEGIINGAPAVVQAEDELAPLKRGRGRPKKVAA